MYSVLIVDDEMIIRTTLHMLVDWNALGLEIVSDANNGEQALQYLKKNDIDVIITDIKMPIMDGIELIRAVKDLDYSPIILVLSGYTDFELVREAFLLGAFDYMLKADINEITIKNTMDKIVTSLQKDKIVITESLEPTLDRQFTLYSIALGKSTIPQNFFRGSYIIIQFEIDHFLTNIKRFQSDLENDLISPMINFALQIPRVASRCILTNISPSRYVLVYEFQQEEQEFSFDTIRSISRQISNVWKNYMNIPVTTGISSVGHGNSDFYTCFKEAGDMLSAKYIYGKDQILIYHDKDMIDINLAMQAGIRYQGLKECFQNLDESMMEFLHNDIFSQLSVLSLEDARVECLYIIYQIAMILKDTNNDIWMIFEDSINYREKIERIDSIRGLEMWITNFLRFIKDYMEHNFDRQQADIIERSKRFIQDNYSNTELTLGMVANYVGLSDKYFSTRFTKVVGNTFSTYLTELRVQKAKELLRKTDLKMYEICDNVGYNNVEHFTRVFKKECEMSPSAYKKGINK